MTGTRSRHFVHFEGGAGERLIDLSDLVEVLPMLAPEGDERARGRRYLGISRVRGEVVPLLTLSPVDDIDPNWLLIIAHGPNGWIGIVAREVFGVMELPASCCRVMPTDGDTHFETATIDDRVVEIVAPRLLDPSSAQ